MQKYTFPTKSTMQNYTFPKKCLDLNKITFFSDYS